MTKLTEAMAAEAFALAWNQLDPTVFVDLLAPDARYASQWVFEELIGRDAIAEYLNQKMHTIRTSTSNSPEHTVMTEVGKTNDSLPYRDCVIMAQGRKEDVKAVVVFEVDGDRIKRYDLCMPELLNCHSL